MKQTASSLLILMAIASCSMHDPQTDPEDLKQMQVSVTAAELTKAPVMGTMLPTGSSIGVSLIDGTGSGYDGSEADNMKYTDSGVSGFDVWTPQNAFYLSGTEATLYSYYPYSENVTDLTAITIETDSQTDYMWGTPVTGVNNSKPAASITMRHALSAIRLSFIKGSYTGTGSITSVTISGDGMASEGTLDATDGTLTPGSAGQDISTSITATLSSTPADAYLMVVPTSNAGYIYITAVVDGSPMTLRTPTVTLQQEKMYTYEITVNSTQLELKGVKVTGWSTSSQGALSFNRKITVAGTTTDITWDTQTHDNGDVTITARCMKDGFKVNNVSISGGATLKSQTQNPDGSLTVEITDFYSNATLSFFGTTYLEWARIQHVDGTLYTAEEWLAAEAAGTVTDADANGVAVRYSKWTSCPHVIHPNYSTENMMWSSNTSVEVPGVYTTTSYNTSDKTSCNYDVAGKANTDALLAAVSAGTIRDAPAAQWASQVVFADGSQGYLPAAGEVCAWWDNKTAINACMDAIGGDQVGVSPWTIIWPSTQYSTERAWLCNYINYNNSYMVGTNDKNLSRYVRAVCAFSI